MKGPGKTPRNKRTEDKMVVGNDQRRVLVMTAGLQKCNRSGSKTRNKFHFSILSKTVNFFLSFYGVTYRNFFMESISSAGEIDGNEMAQAKTEPGESASHSFALGTRTSIFFMNIIIILWGFIGLVFRGDPRARKKWGIDKQR